MQGAANYGKVGYGEGVGIQIPENRIGTLPRGTLIYSPQKEVFSSDIDAYAVVVRKKVTSRFGLSILI